MVQQETAPYLRYKIFPHYSPSVHALVQRCGRARTRTRGIRYTIKSRFVGAIVGAEINQHR